MHVMLDLETFGTAPGSIIRSIGAMTFDPSGNEIEAESFYANIDHQSCLDAGLTRFPRAGTIRPTTSWLTIRSTRSSSTVEWWNKQSAEAKAHFESPKPQPLRDVAESFHLWFVQNNGKYLWCQGANFDAVLWDSVCRIFNKPSPWRYYNVRDTRTAYDLALLDARSIARNGIHHSALDDARHQARCVQEAYRRLQTRIDA